MIINVLECRADGSQETVQREVSEDYFEVFDEPERENENGKSFWEEMAEAFREGVNSVD